MSADSWEEEATHNYVQVVGVFCLYSHTNPVMNLLNKYIFLESFITPEPKLKHCCPSSGSADALTGFTNGTTSSEPPGRPWMRPPINR